MARSDGSKESRAGGARVALVTGASGAIGKAIAQGIAELPDHEVVLLCREEAKASDTCHEVIRATGNTAVRFELADLSRRSSIRAFAERWRGPLHVLINNAAVTPRRRQETPEGIELQFATNVLGYFWMILDFSDHLKRSAPSRVVNVASYWAGDLDLSDLEFKRRRYANGEAYRQSKQANRMLTATFADRLRSSGVSVNACHPGDVPSTLSSNLGFRGSQTPEEAARTPIWLAVDPAGHNLTGRYFEQMREVRCPFGQNRRAVQELYEICLSF